MANSYCGLPPDFYEASLRSMNPLQRYYHSNRYAKVRRFISARYLKGMRILDIGCGSANWNTGKLQVEGVDQTEQQLRYGKSRGYLSGFVVWNLDELPLPFEEHSFDFIVLAEVLEHMGRPARLLAEARRLLKGGGKLVATVPLDTPLSAWSLLFGAECFVLGDVLGNRYYRERCGHVHHFSFGSLAELLRKNGFSVIEKDVTMMNIGVVAVGQRAGQRR